MKFKCFLAIWWMPTCLFAFSSLKVELPTQTTGAWVVSEVEDGQVIQKHVLPIIDQTGGHWGRMVTSQVNPQSAWTSFWGGAYNMNVWENDLIIRLRLGVDSFVSGDPHTVARDFVRPIQSDYFTVLRFSLPNLERFSGGYFHLSSHKTKTPLGAGPDLNRARFDENGASNVGFIEYQYQDADMLGLAVGQLQQTGNTVPHLLRVPAYFFNVPTGRYNWLGNAGGMLLYGTRSSDFSKFRAKVGAMVSITEFKNWDQKRMGFFYGVGSLNLERALGKGAGVGISVVGNQARDTNLSLYFRLIGQN